MRAALRGADKGMRLAKVAELPAIVYVWRDDALPSNPRNPRASVMLCDDTLPEVPSGRIVGVYHLVDVGEMHVTRELKR